MLKSGETIVNVYTHTSIPHRNDKSIRDTSQTGAMIMRWQKSVSTHAHVYFYWHDQCLQTNSFYLDTNNTFNTNKWSPSACAIGFSVGTIEKVALLRRQSRIIGGNLVLYQFCYLCDENSATTDWSANSVCSVGWIVMCLPVHNWVFCKWISQ